MFGDHLSNQAPFQARLRLGAGQLFLRLRGDGAARLRELDAILVVDDALVRDRPSVLAKLSVAARTPVTADANIE